MCPKGTQSRGSDLAQGSGKLGLEDKMREDSYLDHIGDENTQGRDP
jgi:hypothetical protein